MGVEIRSAEVNAAVSPVSAVPEVRARLLAMQREAIAGATSGPAGAGHGLEADDHETVARAVLDHTAAAAAVSGT